MWPPSEREWTDILKPLPPDADRAAFRQAIEVAVSEYVEDARGHKQRLSAWREIGRVADLQQNEKLCRAILRLSGFPNEPGADAILRLGEALRQLPSDADRRAVFYLSTSRRGRFETRLSLAWTGPGRGDLPISVMGPFVDSMKTITAFVFDRPLDGSGIKKFARRERARRDTLTVLDQVVAAQINMHIDDGKVYVIDPSGQRKS